MEDIYRMILALIFLLISFYLLDRNKYAHYITRYVKKYSWILAKEVFRYTCKLLRKVTSRFDPY